MKYTAFNNRPFEVHTLLLNKISPDTNVLELGCATGYFSKKLKEKDCTVVGVEYEKAAAVIAEKICDSVILADLEHPETVTVHNKQFDYVLCMDVIEHIRNREALISGIRKWLKPNGLVLLTTPNIAHISIRWKLLTGDFTYTTVGILDETHVHFFIKKTITKLLEDCGLKITSLEMSADFGQIPFIGRFLRHIPKQIQYHITQKFPNLLGVQFVIEAKK